MSLCLGFLDCVDVLSLNGWVAGRGSLPAWIRSTWGVSLFWGLCEAFWAGLLVSGCMFPIGCFCLTKTQWDCGLLKDAVSLFRLSSRKNNQFHADYIIHIFHWWNTFILTRSSHTDGTILCNQHMNGIWMLVLFSHPEHRDYTPVLTQAVVSFYAVCEIQNGLSTLNRIPGNKGRL